MDVGCTAVCWSLNASTFIILFDMYIQHFPFHILLPSLFPLFLVETWEPISLGFHTLTPGMPQRLLVKLLVLFACFFFFVFFLFFFSTTIAIIEKCLKMLFGPLIPNINIHILLTILLIFLMLLVGRIGLKIKTFDNWWSFSLFSWPAGFIK